MKNILQIIFSILKHLKNDKYNNKSEFLSMISIRKSTEFCCEDIKLIENYEEAINSDKMYECHHRLEIQNNKRVTQQSLIEQNLYWKRPASELIFLERSVHRKLHSTGNFNPFYNKAVPNKVKGNIGKASSKEFKWLTPSGEIKIMNRSNATRWHPDWTKIGEV